MNLKFNKYFKKIKLNIFLFFIKIAINIKIIDSTIIYLNDNTFTRYNNMNET